tara:strand:+ start:193 stop:438 length:246 start_codon:yes stop_codon:yes gene_type:complete
MATDKKISQLNPLAAVDIDLGNDSLVIVNNNESKKITPDNLMSGRVKSSDIDNIVKITQNAYDDLVTNNTVDANTLYIITI